MPQFNWDDAATHIDGLREMGCAVVIITPEDIQTLTADDETDEPTVSDEEAAMWLRDNADTVEGAILGDYWSDTVRDILDQKPIYKRALLTIERKRFSTTQGEVLLTYDGERIEQFGDEIKMRGPNNEYDGHPDDYWHEVAATWLHNGKRTFDQLFKERCRAEAAVREAAAAAAA